MSSWPIRLILLELINSAARPFRFGLTIPISATSPIVFYKLLAASERTLSFAIDISRVKKPRPQSGAATRRSASI